jgi:diadenosine tetraphosphate (Ap4A) HIT family hydrolase
MRESVENSCVFCGIVAGRLPASVVYRDSACVAFMDISPINPGHTLVVPVKHAAELAELTVLDGAAVFTVAQRIGVALRHGALASLGVRCAGVNLLLSDGATAGQVVGHVHLHVIPRYRGDGAGFRRGQRASLRPRRAMLDQLSRALASGMSSTGGS